MGLGRKSTEHCETYGTGRITLCNQKFMPGAGEMAQQGKALAAKPDDLSSSPGT